MNIYYGARLSGKSSILVIESAKTGAIIVAPNYQMCDYLVSLAKMYGLEIPQPITVNRYIRILHLGGMNKTQKYLIDELQMVLHQMNVEIATVSHEALGSVGMYDFGEDNGKT